MEKLPLGKLGVENRSWETFGLELRRVVVQTRARKNWAWNEAMGEWGLESRLKFGW